ncbi:MAG: FCD domain-containing protein [Actinobacteria bacterium]|jgi:DNA-binding FadR family transcriptional regulator|uniref:Unannotated protein n=1 Tax=freshwater metagenome TaxID=449393 RepID=A0A6J6DP86_9ZZZZ|nr:FCD domain-containing protein [Actinomycetota bacterium]MTA32671.1 FCD domain-containing protein [Actinomycetota bacterium]
MVVRRTTLVGATVDELISLIETRQLSAGDSLPSTAELAEQLDVSRTVVREAIAELAGQGLLIRRQGKDTEISFPDSDQFERMVRLRFALAGAQFDQLQEFRVTIEIGAARLAAQRATVEDNIALKKRLDAIVSVTDMSLLHEADQAFHSEVARISRNDFIIMSLEGISPLLIELRKRAWSGWVGAGRNLQELIHAHAEVLDAIVAREPEWAAEAMARHLDQARMGLEVAPHVASHSA